MEKDLITIIIPVYKVEQYLDKCVSSIIFQSYENLEIILVDDGSPDRCPQMCDRWAKKDSRIKVVHKENGGLSSARNAGIDRAEGKYIAFVDSDDYIDRRMMEKLHMRMKEDGSEMALCGIYSVDYGNGGKTEALSDMGNTVWDKKNFWDYHYKKNSIPLVAAWNKLYLAKLFEKERYDIGKLYEDEFILHRLVEQCQRISVVSDKLYYYVQRQGSITHSYSAKRLDRVEAALKRSRYFAWKKEFTYAFLSLGSIPSVLSEAYVRLGIKKNPQYRRKYKKLKKEYNMLKRKYYQLKGNLGLLYNMKFFIKDTMFNFSEAVYFFVLNQKIKICLCFMKVRGRQ